MKAGTSREDLYSRISGATVRLPPLRERSSDVLPLAGYFLRKAAVEARRSLPRILKSASAALLQHPRRRNAREVQNAMEYALMVSDGKHIGVEHLPSRLRWSRCR
jgi:DNA-binding NtrC family response regulator